MKAQELMTPSPACCTPEDTVQDAARLMQECDCGLIPVVEDRESHRIVGTITDRDIAVRAAARGMGPDTRVRDVMSTNPSYTSVDAEVSEVERIMSDRQVRRVPVVDGDRRVVGIIAQADLARAVSRSPQVSEREVHRVVERISQPSESSGSRGAGRSAERSTERGSERDQPRL
ncbi:MAG TPA: CBS domain-containing protein [Gemmatimonadaceae bacterium]|nr:CBS domain-containing protein [Gemmatimonadaceae bacterium]